jgi:type III restriction enzyme
MKIKFNANLDYQTNAIESVVNLFHGQKIHEDNFSIMPETGVISNYLDTSKEKILKNLQYVQKQNELKISEKLDGMDFSIEMETGTGKTYVYLKTIFELNKKYGFKKFIIIVPSVAIREGVKKTLKDTKEHFKKQFENIEYSFNEYDSKKLNSIRQFSRTNKIEILILTLASFDKDSNIMNRVNEKFGDKSPGDYISETRPILILDEPQNMESELAKKALSKLNPMFVLRYSATHRNLYNLVYRLTPVDAYNLRIVKRIDVAAVVKEGDFNKAFIRCLEIKVERKGIKVKLEVSKKFSNEIKLTKMFFQSGDDLQKKTNSDEYQGYVITNIDARDNIVKFSNGESVNLGKEHGGEKETIMKIQIEQTIEEHFKKTMMLKKFGIKVLSLFFIDRVDNYVNKNGMIRKFFIESFNELKSKPEYQEFKDLDVDSVHSGYFSQGMKSEKGIRGDKEAYEKIMVDKEKLLIFEEPIQFIFSHSALREGWDNPNVFNICTLNQTQSIIKKRQEIGRGLRIPVNQEGDRIYEKEMKEGLQSNILTVIANESYSSYVSQLQQEYFDEYGEVSSPPIRNRYEKKSICLKKNFELDKNFIELWKKISKKTEYQVKIDSSKFIKNCIEKINKMNFIQPTIRIEKVELKFNKKEKLDSNFIGVDSKLIKKTYSVPNIVKIISKDTKITKKTIVSILDQTKNLKLVYLDPRQYLDLIILIITKELDNFLINGIKYTPINDSFKHNKFTELQTYSDLIILSEKSIYEKLVCDSDNEMKFANNINDMDDVKLIIKLPRWFTIPTPIGEYNPDWAILMECKDRFGKIKEKKYFVAETKGSLDAGSLRLNEQRKIDCGRKHFEAIGVFYDVFSDASELRKKICN